MDPHATTHTMRAAVLVGAAADDPNGLCMAHDQLFDN
jgi:hypothetical protein